MIHLIQLFFKSFQLHFLHGYLLSFGHLINLPMHLVHHVEGRLFVTGWNHFRSRVCQMNFSLLSPIFQLILQNLPCLQMVTSVIGVVLLLRIINRWRLSIDAYRLTSQAEMGCGCRVIPYHSSPGRIMSNIWLEVQILRPSTVADLIVAILNPILVWVQITSSFYLHEGLHMGSLPRLCSLLTNHLLLIEIGCLF